MWKKSISNQTVKMYLWLDKEPQQSVCVCFSDPYQYHGDTDSEYEQSQSPSYEAL